MNYGELIDSDFKPEREIIYNYFTTYFGNPTMIKLQEEKSFSVYVAEISCLLNRENRFLIIIVKSDRFPLRTQKMMSELSWESLQTRALHEKNDVLVFKYLPRRYQPLMDSIKLVEKTQTHFTYHTDKLPLIVTLLPDLNGKLEYQPTGNLITAIETFHTIINFK